ncbi:hypothetical protein BDN72DRAFT_552386 [Pluteus cervinus]|uniref:Uncharacterized protein n=1 Tax=Pluteus cervinus TaxID=181527 RepID=A0ACD3AX15_9AGAR|nr:hypothetical protein BDN72DRAFT_552386 [Pluteus cervinus]
MLMVPIEHLDEKTDDLASVTRQRRLSSIQFGSDIVVICGIPGIYFFCADLPKEVQMLHTLRILGNLWQYSSIISAYGCLAMYWCAPRNTVNISLSALINFGAAVLNAFIFVVAICSLHEPSNQFVDMHPVLKMMNAFGFFPLIASCYTLVAHAQLFAGLSASEWEQFFAPPWPFNSSSTSSRRTRTILGGQAPRRRR